MRKVMLSTLTWLWCFKGPLILYILITLSVIWSCTKPPPLTLEETMVALLEGAPQDQVMELYGRQYQYQREEAARQAQEYQELLRNRQPERCRQGGSYGHQGEPLFHENY